MKFFETDPLHSEHVQDSKADQGLLGHPRWSAL